MEYPTKRWEYFQIKKKIDIEKTRIDVDVGQIIQRSSISLPDDVDQNENNDSIYNSEDDNEHRLQMDNDYLSSDDDDRSEMKRETVNEMQESDEDVNDLKFFD